MSHHGRRMLCSLRHVRFKKLSVLKRPAFPIIALSPQAGPELTVRNFLALYAEALHTYKEMVEKMDKNLQVSC